MKKWFSAALCLLLMLALLVPAAAAEGPVFKIVPAQTEVKPGDTLTFTVQVESTDTCKSYGLVLTFDPAVFEVVSGECTAQNAALAVFEPTRGFAVMLNDAGSPAGELGSFTLKVKNSAAAGDAVISGESSVKNGAETIASQVVGATVRIAGAAQPGQTEQTQPTQSTQQTDPVPSTEGVQTTEPAGTAPAGDDPVAKAIGIMETNYPDSINIGDLARDVGLARAYFTTLFTEQTGLPPYQYLTRLRIRKACSLLADEPNRPVAQIAELVGMDPRNFSRFFKREMGISPLAYRKSEEHLK